MSRKPDPTPSLLERAHPRDPSRRLAFVSYVTPDGRRRQKLMGDAGSPKAERNYRQFLKDYLAQSFTRGAPGSAPVPDSPPDHRRVAARFLHWADGYYQKDGRPNYRGR